MESDMDFIQLIEDLDNVNNNEQDSAPLSMTEVWNSGDVLLDMAVGGDHFQPQPLQVLMGESSFPESLPAKDCHHEGTDTLQGQLEETECSDFEDQNSDPINEILELMQWHTNDNPTAEAEENDPHKAASIQKILEHMLAGADHLLPVPAQPIHILHPLHSRPTATLALAETNPSVPVLSDQHQQQTMTVCTENVADTLLESLVPVEEIKDKAVCDGPSEVLFAAFNSSAASVNNHMTRKRTHSNQEGEEKPYIKKPPNAFMVFRQEQRAKVITELNIRDSALVNTELGLRWKCMSKQDKLKYFQEADRLKCLHAQQNPDWSSSDNYGKKRKRIRRNYSRITNV